MFVAESSAGNIEGGQQALAGAKQQAAEGGEPFEIWDDTNCFEGPDGVWRIEIPDDDMHLTGNLERGAGPMPLDEVVHHPTLYEAAPELEGTMIEIAEPGTDVAEEPGFLGAYSPSENRIVVKESDLPVIVHEIQHAIQENQGMPEGSRGTNPEAAGSMEAYQSDYGEVEANDAAERLDGQDGPPDLLITAEEGR